MQVELPPESMNEVVELIYSGQKIAACKRYKELRGTSLLEAKTFIENLTEQLKAADPERFTKSSGAGCSTSIVLGSAFLGCSVWWLSNGVV